MKPLCTLTLALVVVVPLAGQTPVDELKQLTAQIQSSPNDRSLRERAIKLAAEMKPAPAVPREAKEQEGAAEYFAGLAKSEADFAKAAAEYEKAALLAPWSASAYYNAGLLYEKAKQPERSLLNYEFYLLAAPDSADAEAVIRRVGAMKAAAKIAADKRVADDEAQRQRDAAAERERQRTGGLRLLRANVESKRFRQLVCGLKPDYKQGCNLDQYYGKSWGESTRTSNGQTIRDYLYWEFYDDTAYLKTVFTGSSAPAQYMLKVEASGPNIEDLRWYFPDYSAADTSRFRPWRPANYIRVNSAGAEIVLGFVKAGEDPSANPKKVYNYYMWKTP